MRGPSLLRTASISTWNHALAGIRASDLPPTLTHPFPLKPMLGPTFCGYAALSRHSVKNCASGASQASKLWRTVPLVRCGV